LLFGHRAAVARHRSLGDPNANAITQNGEICAMKVTSPAWEDNSFDHQADADRDR
jgi:hypothetical protein